MRMTILFALLGATLCVSCASCRSGANGQAPGGGGDPSSEAGTAGTASAVPLPGGSGGIGFDDLGFAAGIRKVLAPAGATGDLDLVDPDTFTITAIAGFSTSQGTFQGGHGNGTTSADEGRGLLFAIDRTSLLLDVVDPAAKKIVASAKLGGSPDYVRWVDATGEVWVTEPDSERIEVFTVPSGPSPTPVSVATIGIKGGPESLVIDSTRKRAFTHLWSGSTVAIDVGARTPIATWPNGCSGSRGIALDSKRGFLFAGCAEGKAVVLDIDHGGKQLGSASSGNGVDVIGYSPTLAHLYLPGATSATMAFIGVSAVGQLSVLGTVPTAQGAHCVTADDRGHAWVCDVNRGQLLVFKDSYPPSGN